MIRHRVLASAALAAILGLLAPAAAPPAAAAESAAPAVDPSGDWIGTLQTPGGPLRLALHVQRQGKVLTVTADSPDQFAYGVAAANVQASGPALTFEIPAAAGRYEGQWDPARQAYAGVWSQSGLQLPLELKRGRFPAPARKPFEVKLDPGLSYTPAPAARARTGPTLPVGKCLNFSNTLEPPSEGAWGVTAAEDDFQIIRAAGFETVRIPVGWSYHAGERPPYAIDPAFLRRVRHVVDLANAAGLKVILNVHHYHPLMHDPDAHADRFVALWRQIGAAFADEPATVWFELLNEPTDKLGGATLDALLARGLAAVRETNPSRVVILGAENWSSLDAMLAFRMPDDPNVVPTFHYYDPFEFTHQGASFMPNPPPMGRGFGDAMDKAQLDQALAKVRGYMARTGRVPLLGEFGAQDDPRVPLEHRVRYYRTVSSAFASIGVPSCAWGYRSGYPIRVEGRWLPGMVEAIAAPTAP